jgi:hypothetical protein
MAKARIRIHAADHLNPAFALPFSFFHFPFSIAGRATHAPEISND